MKKVTYNNDILTNNITEVRRRIRMPVGEFESTVGVSKGYFARLKRSGTPSVSIMANIRELAKGKAILDAIVAPNLSPLNHTDAMMFKFFMKLLEDTRSGKIIWTAENSKRVNDPGSDNRPPHILEKLFTNENGYKEQAYDPVCKDEDEIKVIDLCFHTSINDDYELYLVRILTDEKGVDYEGHIAKEGKTKPAFSTKMMCDELSAMAKAVYQAAKMSMMNPRIPLEASKYIDRYMKRIYAKHADLAKLLKSYSEQQDGSKIIKE